MGDKMLLLEEFEKNIKNITSDLSDYKSNDNIFEILNIVDKELKHSDFLAFIINPNGSHGLEDTPLKSFLNYINKTNDTKIDIQNFNDVKVLREYKNMDILIISESEKIVICIENKIGTVNSEGQLEKYDEKLNIEFKSYEIYRMYLTPGGERPIEYNGNYYWMNISYSDILNSLNVIDIKSIKKDNIRYLFIDYIDNLRRNIIMIDNELKERCNQIYLDNKEIFDLIYKYKDDEIDLTTNAIKKYLNDLKDKNLIEYKENHNASTTMWFVPNTLQKYLPCNIARQNKCLGYMYIYLERKTLTCYVSFAFNYNAIINYDDISDAREMNDRINNYLKNFDNIKPIEYKDELYKNKNIGAFSIEDKKEEEILSELNNIIKEFL